jgi:Tfp pilus assembly protein PilF
MRRLNVTGRFGTPGSLLLAALLLCGCATAKKPNESWKGEKAYGARMARSGFWHEALFRFEKAAELHPDDAEIQNDLAVAYESVGDTAHALAAYKRALELAPTDQKIKRNYARFAEYYTSIQRATGPAASQ